MTSFDGSPLQWRRSFVTVRPGSDEADGAALAHVRTAGPMLPSTCVLLAVSPLASWMAFAEQIAKLVATGRRVVVVDLPGTGASGACGGSLADWINQVVGAVDADELLALGPPAGSAEALTDLAERLRPRQDGGHLAAAADAVRSAWVFSPWHVRTSSARLRSTVPDAAALHDAALRLLEDPAGLVARGAWFDALAAHDLRPVRVVQETAPKRTYANVRFGQVHVRIDGVQTSKPTLLSLHPSPGSAQPYSHVNQRLSATRRVLAPDMLGNGDSDLPVMHHAPNDALSPEFADTCGTSRTLADYADEALAVLDAMGEDDPVDIWGNHTGALIGMELAIRHPHRIRRLVMDGITIFDAAETADILAHYLPAFALDSYGAHLLRAWGMRHDMTLFWPWYRTNEAGWRAMGAVSPEVLHANTMELLRSGPSFRVAYDAAFRYPTAARLPLLPGPTMLTVQGVDPLAGAAAGAVRLLPSLRCASIDGYGPDAVEASVRTITDFLDES